MPKRMFQGRLDGWSIRNSSRRVENKGAPTVWPRALINSGQ
jgi:hypothetical protein